MTKTATLSLHGNRYEVDAALVGRRIEVVFDPFDLTTLEVRFQGRSMGIAVPHRIGRHVHPDTPTPATGATGIDYLALITAQHHKQLAARINYTDLSGDPVQGDQDDQLNQDDMDDEDDRSGALEAELASFTALRQELANGELPGQLDLTDLIDEHSDHNSEGPQ